MRKARVGDLDDGDELVIATGRTIVTDQSYIRHIRPVSFQTPRRFPIGPASRLHPSVSLRPRFF